MKFNTDNKHNKNKNKNNNNNKIQIEESDFLILREILGKYPYKFYVYGSRARGDASRYSDLDIFCKEKIAGGDLVSLKMELEESNLTIKVDVLDLGNCLEEFAALIEKDLIDICLG
jgi:predicted nucleotidyltransferase